MDSLFQAQIFYELAMAIGNNLDLDKMLEECLTAYLGKLNCSAGFVFELRNGSCEAPAYTPIFSLPQNMAVSDYQTTLACIPSYLSGNNLQAFLKTLPISVTDDKGRPCHFMDLPGFGLLLLVGGNIDFQPSMTGSLDRLNRKLANSCLACVRHMQTKNITDGKLAKDELFKSNQMLQSVLDNIPLRVFWKNCDSVVIGCNKAFAVERGYMHPREVVGKSTWDLNPVPPEMAQRFVAADREVMATGKAKLNYEDSLIRLDGSVARIIVSKVPMFDRQGRITGILGIYEDITERKNAEEERMRMVTAIEQSADGILIADTNWNIEYVNPALTAMTGYTTAEVVGQHMRILKSDKHDRTFFRNIRETLRKGEPWSGRLINRKKDGSLYETEVAASPVRNTLGAIINYVAIHRDISNQVRLEKHLRQAQKMEAIGTLAGGIAHDFNNILAAIVGYTELAVLRLPDDDPLRRNLDQVLKASARASDLVRRILSFSRQTEQSRQPVSVISVVKDALALLRPSLPTTIEIRSEISLKPDDGFIFADPTEIHQVLMNLCTNAAHAMRSKGGVLSVELSQKVVTRNERERRQTGNGESPASGPRVSHARLEPGDYIRVAISDTGHGIKPEIMDRIFDPYFTTKKVGEGTGLGLSVVQGIVSTYGGSIMVHSKPGEGTTFDVYFRGMEKQTVIRTEQRGDLCTGAGKILFVDDEEALARLGSEILGSLGYKVVAKTSSLEALETFRTDPHGFDLVVTDMTMPNLKGEELAREIIAIRPGMPIVLCTGYSDLINEKLPYELGVSEFIMKPYNVGAFAEVVRKAIKRCD